MCVQRYYRGIMARRTVKEKYGFEAHLMSAKQDNPQTFTQSDAQVMEARRLVMQIRGSLESFQYGPSPANYDSTVRTTEKMVTLDNGAEYEGEWDY
jgi:hypothetical protein